jgi:hypothetical protein
MMISQGTLDHLEVIMWSVIIAAGVGAVVMTFVGALTLLVFREPAHAGVPVVAPAVPKAEPVVAAAQERKPADVSVAAIVG